MEHKLGVIGGMGPKATSVFFEKLVDSTVANRDQDHINMVILNHATLPDRTKTILENRGSVFLEAIRQDIKLLEFAGVTNIAIPCNTSHFFYDQLQEMTDINIISMVDETIKVIYEKFGENSKVGILATNGTIRSGIYKKVCDKYKINLHIPSESIQEQTMDIIYTNVKGDIGLDATELEGIIHKLIFEENCCCVILACTELSCFKLSEEVAKHCVDAMEVLVEKSIERSGGTSKHMQLRQNKEK